MLSRMMLRFGFALCLLVPMPGFGAQSFEIQFDGFEDLNGNGTVDCTEVVTYRIALFQDAAPQEPETGVITVPFNTSVGFAYIPGSIEPDFIFSDACTYGILDGNDPGDRRAVVSYFCDPHAGNPLDENYFFQFRVSGYYQGGAIGPIVVDAQNDRTSPTVGSLHSVDVADVATNPCLPPPDLSLTKMVVSGDGSAGSILLYDLAVTNTGGVSATDVVLEESIPQNTTFYPGSSSPGWICSPDGNAGSTCRLSLGTLAGGGAAIRSFAVQVASSFPAGSPATIDNTACTSSTPPDDSPANNCDSTSTASGRPDLATLKSVVSGSGSPGETLVYDLAVSNRGNRAAAGVQLTETVPALATFLPASSSAGWICSPNNNAGSTCTLALGTVAAGVSVVRTFAVQLASTFPPNPPPIDNTACSSTTTSGDPAANNCGSVSTPPGGNPDLRTTKSVASGTGDPGALLVYGLIVANLGNRDAAGVQLTETVPALATFQPGTSSPGWSCTPTSNAGATCTLAVGTVAAGASVSRTFAVQLASTFPSNPPSIDNTACSSTATTGDPAANNCGSVSTPPGGSPDLRTTKSLASGNGDPGELLVYELIVANLGNRDAAGVQLTETVPALSTFNPGASSPGWSCTPNNNASATCTLAVGSVAAGASVNRTFAVQLAATFPPNPPSIDNTACSSTTTAGDPAANDCGSVSTPPGGNPDLRTTKSLASGSGDPGALLVYELIVANLGNRDAAGVQLTETVPILATFIPGASSPGWSCTPNNSAGSTCTLAVGTVGAGASASRTFAVRLVATFPPNPPPIDNTACSSTTTSGDPAANNCGSVSTPPEGNPDLQTAKSLASGSADPGGVLVYSLVVTNIGNRDAAGVELTETVPALSTFLPGSSSPGWSCAPTNHEGSTCTLAVGTVAAGASLSWAFAVQLAAAFPANPPPIENMACSSSVTNGDPSGNNCGSITTPPGGNPDVRLIKTVASGSGDPGGVLVFELAVSNGGTRDAAGVVVEETVPQLTSFLPAASSPGWTCAPDGNAGSSCTLPVRTLAAGSSSIFTFAVQVAGTFPPNPPPIENTACVTTSSGGDPEANNCGTTTTPPGGAPDLRMVKSVASGDASPGSVLVYALAVSNLGTRDAEGVVVQESVPELTTFLPGSSSPGWSCTPDGNAGSSCALVAGTVAAGSSVTYTFAVEVASTFPSNPPLIQNSACVSTTSGGDPSGNDCGSTSTPPGGGPDLVLQKSLAAGAVVPDGVLVFALTLRNQGTREATGVVLRETVPPDTAFESADSSPGWTCTPDSSAGAVCTLGVGVINAGATTSYTFAVRLPPDLPAGTQVGNTACVDQEAEGTAGPEADCATVIIDPPGPQEETDVEVEIGVEEAQLFPGTPFLFTLTLHNASGVQAAGLRVSVALPSFGPEPTELDPACQNLDGRFIECRLPQLAGGESVQFTWKHAALRVGEYTVSAELMAATPEDVDSVTGNGELTEDDYAEVSVSVSSGPEVLHDVPTLSSVGLCAMVLLLLALGVAFVRRGGFHRLS